MDLNCFSSSVCLRVVCEICRFHVSMKELFLSVHRLPRLTFSWELKWPNEDTRRFFWFNSAFLDWICILCRRKIQSKVTARQFFQWNWSRGTLQRPHSYQAVFMVVKWWTILLVECKPPFELSALVTFPGKPSTENFPQHLGKTQCFWQYP